MKQTAQLQVDANLLDLAAETFDWEQGRIHFTSNFNVDNATTHAPLGNAVTLDIGAENTHPDEWFKSIVVDGQLGVGTGTGGSLDIVGGRATSASGRIGGSGVATRLMRVRVEGSNSSWLVTNDLAVGTLPTNPGAQLDVAAGGTLSVGNSSGDLLKVWDDYAVTMNQSAITARNLTARNLTVRGTIAPAAGALIPGHVTVAGATVIDGGSLSLTALSSNLVASSSVTVQNDGQLTAYIHGGAGTQVTVGGAGSAWTTPNVVPTILGSTTSGVGRIHTLTLNAGGVRTSPAASLSHQPPATA